MLQFTLGRESRPPSSRANGFPERHGSRPLQRRREIGLNAVNATDSCRYPPSVPRQPPSWSRGGMLFDAACTLAVPGRGNALSAALDAVDARPGVFHNPTISIGYVKNTTGTSYADPGRSGGGCGFTGAHKRHGPHRVLTNVTHAQWSSGSREGDLQRAAGDGLEIKGVPFQEGPELMGPCRGSAISHAWASHFPDAVSRGVPLRAIAGISKGGVGVVVQPQSPARTLAICAGIPLLSRSTGTHRTCRSGASGRDRYFR